MLLYGLILVLIAGKLLGGQFGKLAQLQLRSGYWLLGLVLIQVCGIFWRQQNLLAGSLLIIASYLGLIAFVIRNRSLPGMYLVLAGIMLNFLVITANGGAMPVTQEALASIGRASRVTAVQPAGAGADAGEAAQVVDSSKGSVTAEPQLLFLGDVIVVPLPGAFATALSVGDLCISLGLSWLILKTMQIKLLTGRPWKVVTG